MDEKREAASRATDELESDIRATVDYIHKQIFVFILNKALVKEAQRHFEDVFNSWDRVRKAYDAGQSAGQPLDVLLWCPRCFEQHVDEAKPDICERCGHYQLSHRDKGYDADVAGSMPGLGSCTEDGCKCEKFTAWLNPAHKSHRCNFCNHVWRPSDAPTNGVQSLTSKGERDEWAKPAAFACGKDFDEAVKIATQHLGGQWQAIHGEGDLPKESGEYLWQRKTPNNFNHLFISDDINVDDIDARWWLREYVAWMPIPPYQGQPSHEDGERK